MSMYPETLHKVMDMATNVYERYYDFLEQEELLLPTVGISPIAQESFAYTNELPFDKAVKTTDCWGFWNPKRQQQYHQKCLESLYFLTKTDL